MIKLFLAFALMGALLWRKTNLTVTMLVAGLGLVVLYGIAPLAVAQIGLTTLVDPSNTELILTMFLIFFLERCLRRCGLFDKLLTSITEVVPDRRLAIMALPALIGFLPSFGGALFSAPMVEEASRDLMLPASLKSFINYWFRHIWEGVFPLYPSILMASVIAKVPVTQMIGIIWPVTIVSASVGGVVAFRAFPKIENRWIKPKQASVQNLLMSVAPIFAVIVGVMAFHWNIPLTLFGVSASLLVLNRVSLKEGYRLFISAWRWEIFFMTISVFCFKGWLEASGGIIQLAETLTRAGIPLIVLAGVLPLMIGFFTGMNTPYVAIAYPILMPLVAGPQQVILLAYAFICGNVGVLVSPTHGCLAMTHQYFGSDYASTYRKMILPVLAIALTALSIITLRNPGIWNL